MSFHMFPGTTARYVLTAVKLQQHLPVLSLNTPNALSLSETSQGRAKSLKELTESITVNSAHVVHAEPSAQSKSSDSVTT